MRIEKTEFSKKLNQLKNIVPTKSSIEASRGVLVKDGYLIASNTYMSVRAKIGGSEGNSETFIIPEKAIGLINSLPAGDMEIKASDTTLKITSGAIKNEFRTARPEDFVYIEQTVEEVSATIPASKFLEALGHTLYAVAIQNPNQLMNGLCLSCKNGKLELCGLDGKRIAWTCLDCNGTFDMIVPKEALDNMLKLDIDEDDSIVISCKGNGVVFHTENYEIFTTLIEGKFFNYARMLEAGQVKARVDRKSFMEAVGRAKQLEILGDNTPLVLRMHDDSIDVTYKNAMSEYDENVASQDKFESPMRIGLNPKYLHDSLKAFDDDTLTLELTSEKWPMLIYADEGAAKALILPINLQKEA